MEAHHIDGTTGEDEFAGFQTRLGGWRQST